MNTKVLMALILSAASTKALAVEPLTPSPTQKQLKLIQSLSEEQLKALRLIVWSEESQEWVIDSNRLQKLTEGLDSEKTPFDNHEIFVINASADRTSGNW